MTSFACGIDIGSTNLKVVLIDGEGRTVFSRTVPTPRALDRGAPATDASGLVETLEAMIIDGWRAAGGGAPLAAIAAAGVGEDGIGLTPTLRPTGLALAWFDNRAEEEAVFLAAHVAADLRIGPAMAADRTAAKWRWLNRHDSAAITGASAGWVALTDYPAVWWTGRRFMSRSLAARTAAYDVFDRQWIKPLLEASGAPALPPVIDAGTIVGTVREGALTRSGAASTATLVVAGGHDHPIAAAAIHRVHPGARVDSLGTANVLYAEATGPARPTPRAGLDASVPVRGCPGIAYLGVIELSAMLARDDDERATLDRMLGASRLAGRPFEDDGTALSAARRRLEAATFRARDALAAMDRLGVAGGAIHATGGWSRSRAFMELRASIFGQPVMVVREQELVAVSAAFLAAEAAGTVPPHQPGADISIVEPDPDWMAAYAERSPAAANGI